MCLYRRMMAWDRIRNSIIIGNENKNTMTGPAFRKRHYDVTVKRQCFGERGATGTPGGDPNQTMEWNDDVLPWPRLPLPLVVVAAVVVDLACLCSYSPCEDLNASWWLKIVWLAMDGTTLRMPLGSSLSMRVSVGVSVAVTRISNPKIYIFVHRTRNFFTYSVHVPRS